MRNTFFLLPKSFLPLWHQFSIENDFCLFGSHFWIPFFHLFSQHDAPKQDLGLPLRSSSVQNPPTPASVRRCQIRECRIWHEPELKDPTWIMTCSPGYPQRPDFSPTSIMLFLARLLPPPKNILKTSLPKSIKISKDHTLDAQCFNGMVWYGKSLRKGPLGRDATNDITHC